MANSDASIENKLDEIMPWIGLYITLASTACTLAMAADAAIGLRHNKLWFPCKHFSLNALTLTLLAVAMKLTQDFDTNLPQNSDTRAAKFTSLAFLSTAMTNFMPSLGSMDDKELLANMAALGILVITVLANVFIEFIQLDWRVYVHSPNWLAPTSLLLLVPALLASGVAAPAIKRDLESKFQEKHRVALMADEVALGNGIAIDEQIQEMMKYWVMSETSSLQFVMARSAVCTTSTLVPIVFTFALVIYVLVAVVESISLSVGVGPALSVYGGYTHWILAIQTIGMIVGLIAPTSRWCVAVGLKLLTTETYGFKMEFKIESYWIRTLVDWRDSFSASNISKHNKCIRYLHDVKCKLLVLLLALLKRSVSLCFAQAKKFVIIWGLLPEVSATDNLPRDDQSNDEQYLNLKRYVLLLDGEADLPAWILWNICSRANETIRLGQKMQPKGLMDLLQRFDNFNGITQFDNIRVPSLHSQEPPNCWSLPVVTLASIAIALPHIAEAQKEWLVRCVSEGLSLAMIVDKVSDKNEQISSIKKAGDASWVGVALYKKWFDMDLRKTSFECKNSEEVLQELSGRAERTVQEFMKEMTDSLTVNPRDWPVKVVAANSMYRISRTVLLSIEVGNEESDDEGLFERLTVMISDILAACLTNLAKTIVSMCHHSAIEKREETVHEAFLLLGKTYGILQLLQQHECPSLDHDKRACIDEWRAFFRQDEVDATPPCDQENVIITVGD